MVKRPRRAAQIRCCLPFLLWLCCSMKVLVVSGADSWPDVLQHMPLGSRIPQLNRTNCVEVMLGAFRSNQTVKALVFMPGATDEFYMFRRAKAELTNASPSLLDAVTALTNQTVIRATFTPPFVLLYTDEDSLTPDIRVDDSYTRDKVQTVHVSGHLNFLDRDWDIVQPVLHRSLRMDVRPWQHSTDSWHFYRHSF